ncbi:MAG: hypothetical protein V1873_04880 [Verrucomicrobiota bacterium]
MKRTWLVLLVVGAATACVAGLKLNGMAAGTYINWSVSMAAGVFLVADGFLGVKRETEGLWRNMLRAAIGTLLVVFRLRALGGL